MKTRREWKQRAKVAEARVAKLEKQITWADEVCKFKVYVNGNYKDTYNFHGYRLVYKGRDTRLHKYDVDAFRGTMHFDIPVKVS